MTMLKRFGFVCLVAGLAVMTLAVGDKLSVPLLSGFVSSADARIGRPLTPVSFAGVARRTVRRCAVGVYYC
jgi:hypothetical protein